MFAKLAAPILALCIWSSTLGTSTSAAASLDPGARRLSHPPREPYAAGHHPAMAIGRDTISRETIEMRLAQDRCMHDTTATRAGSVAELVVLQLEYEVLKQAFLDEPPDSSVRWTAARLPQVTHDSAALACIMALGDTSFFLDQYVRPTLVNPRLYYRFYSDTTIHHIARDSIRTIFNTLRPNPGLFFAYHIDTIVIKRSDSDMMQIPLVRNVISKLGHRKLWPEIIESDLDFSIVMLDTTTDSSYRALAIHVFKQPFDLWFRDYVKRNIPITFLDKQLEAEFRKTYPTVWWLTDRD